MITPEQTRVNTQELITKVNSGCYLSVYDRDNIVSLVLEQQGLLCNQRQEINELKRLFPLLEVTKINTDEERQLAVQYNIRSIPTLILLDLTGEEYKRLTGSVTDAKLKEFFE